MSSRDSNMNARVYRLEMEMHRERVASLAAVVYELIPGSRLQLSSELSAEILLLKRYLLLHDAPKVQELGELSHHGYRNSSSIAERLSSFYGFHHNELTSDQGQALNQVIVDLNEVEVQQKQEFFIHHEIPSDMRERFARAEMIADVTDTGIARQDEMGLNHQAYNGYQFLIERGDFNGAALSRWLEDNYREILKQQFS